MEKEFDLRERISETRSKRQVKVREQSVTEIYSQFKKNIEDIEKKYSIAEKIDSEEARRDIWRSQIVFLESSLDYYMHCITKYGMQKMFQGDWEKTEKYSNFKVTMEVAEQAIKNPEDSEWFRTVVNNAYISVTMMDKNTIKNQMNLLGLNFNRVGSEAFNHSETDKSRRDQIEEFLSRLYTRRNQIAHQADCRHDTGEKLTIDKADVERYIEKVVKIVDAIHEQILEKNDE